MIGWPSAWIGQSILLLYDIDTDNYVWQRCTWSSPNSSTAVPVSVWLGPRLPRYDARVNNHCMQRLGFEASQSKTFPYGRAVDQPVLSFAEKSSLILDPLLSLIPTHHRPTTTTAINTNTTASLFVTQARIAGLCVCLLTDQVYIYPRTQLNLAAQTRTRKGCWFLEVPSQKIALQYCTPIYLV